jgi:hypothetical protein
MLGTSDAKKQKYKRYGIETEQERIVSFIKKVKKEYKMVTKPWKKMGISLGWGNTLDKNVDYYKVKYYIPVKIGEYIGYDDSNAEKITHEFKNNGKSSFYIEKDGKFYEDKYDYQNDYRGDMNEMIHDIKDDNYITLYKKKEKKENEQTVAAVGGTRKHKVSSKYRKSMKNRK